MKIYDLFYIGERDAFHEVKALVEKVFPTAKIEDASDEIHTYRLSVDMEFTSDETEYVRWVLRNRLYGASFHVEMWKHDHWAAFKQIANEVITEIGAQS